MIAFLASRNSQPPNGMPRDSYRGSASRALTKTSCVRSSASLGLKTRLAMNRWIGAAYASKMRPKASRSPRSEEHTSELQSHVNLVCRLLLEKKKNTHHPLD